MTPMELITQNHNRIRFIGPGNGKLRQVRHILRNTAPNPERLFVLDGLWAHRMAYAAGLAIRSFIICPECVRTPEAAQMAVLYMDKTADVYGVSRKAFDTICARDEPDGLLSLAVFPHFHAEELKLGSRAVVLVLDALELPGNIGTMIRTCDGAGADAVFVCNRRARPTHPLLIKSSMGAAFFVPFVEFGSAEDCRSYLNRNCFQILLADTDGKTSYNTVNYSDRCALVIGNERYGISKSWYDGAKSVSVPMRGRCDSLNAGVAASIILYEITSRRCL